MSKTQLIFLDMLFHALNNKDKVNIVFVPSRQEVSKLYECISEKLAKFIHINLSNDTIHCTESGSRLMIKTPSAQPDHFRGIEIDWYEENGCANYETWKMLKRQTR